MNKLLRWGLTALVVSSAVLAPWVATALYSVSPRALESGGWAMLNEITGRRVLNLTRDGHIQKLGASDLVIGELDVKEYIIYVADLGTASSNYFVIPTTGALISVSATHDAWTQGTAATIRLYSDAVSVLVQHGGGYTNSRITAFSMSIASGEKPGAVTTDDSLGQYFNMGHVLAIETDGGPTNVVPARFTLRFRQQ